MVEYINNMDKFLLALVLSTFGDEKVAITVLLLATMVMLFHGRRFIFPNTD